LGNRILAKALVSRLPDTYGLKPLPVTTFDTDRTPEEIRSLLSPYKDWHNTYTFGSVTMEKTSTEVIGGKQRNLQRFQFITGALLDYCGGTLSGKSVLDVGSSDGFWGLQAYLLGASKVLCIEPRREIVEQSKTIMELARAKVEVVCASVYELSSHCLGQFDVVLAPGLLYHLSKPVYALEKLAEVTRDVCVIDTHVISGEGKAKVIYENHEYFINAVEFSGLVWYPTLDVLLRMINHAGFDGSVITPNMRDLPRDYLEGSRVVIFAHKT